jgi:hypothetical protein
MLFHSGSDVTANVISEMLAGMLGGTDHRAICGSFCVNRRRLLQQASRVPR